MLEITKYSFANGKIRAMLSYLLTKEEFFSLYMKDIDGIIEELKNKKYYRNIFSKIHKKELENLPLTEKILKKNDIGICRKIKNFIPTRREKEFISLFIEKYEVEQIKTALSLWHKKVSNNIHNFLIEEKIVHKIDYKKIIDSSSYDEIISLVEKTPYKKPLIEAKNFYNEEKSIFYPEIFVDIYYYKKLIEESQKLSKMDREVMKRIIGVIVDIENIRFLFRIIKYYPSKISKLYSFIILEGKYINLKEKKLKTEKDFLDFLSKTPYASLTEFLNSDYYKFENFLYQILYDNIHKILYGFPFTIGTPVGYMILKERETKNLISLLYGKKYNWEREKLKMVLK